MNRTVLVVLGIVFFLCVAVGGFVLYTKTAAKKLEPRTPAAIPSFENPFSSKPLNSFGGISPTPIATAIPTPSPTPVPVNPFATPTPTPYQNPFGSNSDGNKAYTNPFESLR